jgi:hypothetical protein
LEAAGVKFIDENGRWPRWAAEEEAATEGATIRLRGEINVDTW